MHMPVGCSVEVRVAQNAIPFCTDQSHYFRRLTWLSTTLTHRLLNKPLLSERFFFGQDIIDVQIVIWYTFLIFFFFLIFQSPKPSFRNNFTLDQLSFFLCTRLSEAFCYGQLGVLQFHWENETIFEWKQKQKNNTWFEIPFLSWYWPTRLTRWTTWCLFKYSILTLPKDTL